MWPFDSIWKLILSLFGKNQKTAVVTYAEIPKISLKQLTIIDPRFGIVHKKVNEKYVRIPIPTGWKYRTEEIFPKGFESSGRNIQPNIGTIHVFTTGTRELKIKVFKPDDRLEFEGF